MATKSSKNQKSGKTKESLPRTLPNYRSNFTQALQEHAKHISERAEVIRQILEMSAKQGAQASKLYESTWKPHFESIAKELRRYEQRIGIRPSLCVMGKRGQGKTSLLQGWLGESDGRLGLSEMCKLPTGDTDTTAAMIRLTGASANDRSRDSRLLYVNLIGPEELTSEIPPDQHPPRPPMPEFCLHRDVEVSADVPPNAPFWICRFPKEGEDDRLFLKRYHDSCYKVTRDGPEDFSDAQWRASEVIIPIDLNGTAQGHGGRLLLTLDVIDAPGADAQAQGRYREWKLRKNAHVFRRAINELDVLLVVCSADTSAIQLGGQFQKDIWYPWLARCNGTGEGRLLIAFSRSAEFFRTARRMLDSETDSHQDTSESCNFATKIFKNVLEPLMGPCPDGPAVLRMEDIGSWPLLFFFEKDTSALKEFTEGFIPGTAKQAAERLVEILQSKEQGALRLSLGERCILRMARDWEEAFKRLPPHERLVIQKWIIEALCSLLDPEDRGYGLLTHWAVSYAETGPMATNHAKERLADAEGIAQRFTSLLDELNRPAGSAEAMELLTRAQNCIRKLMECFPRGPRITPGARCKARFDAIRVNVNPLTRNDMTFSPTEAIVDVIEDSLTQFSGKELNWSSTEICDLKTVLHQCLTHDHVMLSICDRCRDTLSQREDKLRLLQCVAIERLVRILAYLQNATNDHLKAVARHCFETNVGEVELLKPIHTKNTAKPSPDDKRVLERVHEAATDLLEAIASNRTKNPLAAEVSDTLSLNQQVSVS